MILNEAMHYAAHINEVVADDQRHMDERLDQVVEQRNAECVDDNCEHGAVEIAGSLWQVLVTGFMDDLGTRLHKRGVRHIDVLSHEDCGYLAVMLQLWTRREQNLFADHSKKGANIQISRTLGQYGVRVAWAQRDPNGSATGYMAFMNNLRSQVDTRR